MEQKTNETRHLRLPDGRRLAYAEYGDPRGVPVIYCHGFPGSRLEAKLFESSMQHSGVRLIAPDRNGLGESDPLPGRRLLDWPAEVAALADALGLERFHLLGVSGGGPYALACAHSLSERLIGVSLVCPLGPLNHPGLLRMMQWPAVFSFTAMRLMPLLTRPLYRHTLVPMAAHRPQWLYRLMLGMLPPPDYRVLASAQVRAVIIASLAESVRQGGAGVLRELELYVAPWGFTPEEITKPVQLWHGSADKIVPELHGRTIAERLPHCQARYVEGEGHFSLPIGHMERILEALIERSP